MRTKTVVLDCDGVLGDYTGAVLDRVNQDKGTQFKYSDVNQWDIVKALGIDRTYFQEMTSAEGFCANLPVLPGAPEAVQELQKIADVYVVTAPTSSSRYWMYERMQWLRTFFDLTPRYIIQADTKHLIWGHLLIEDSLDNLRLWAARWSFSQGLLVDRPYNRCNLLPGNIQRTHNWQEVLQAVKEYE